MALRCVYGSEQYLNLGFKPAVQQLQEFGLRKLADMPGGYVDSGPVVVRSMACQSDWSDHAGY